MLASCSKQRKFQPYRILTAAAGFGGPAAGCRFLLMGGEAFQEADGGYLRGSVHQAPISLTGTKTSDIFRTMAS